MRVTSAVPRLCQCQNVPVGYENEGNIFTHGCGAVCYVTKRLHFVVNTVQHRELRGGIVVCSDKMAILVSVAEQVWRFHQATTCISK
jgi:hypothetical protein